MAYKIKITKNGTETYEDTLHITNMLGSIMNDALYPHYITPFSDTYMNACLLFSDTIEKRNDNIDVFESNLIGGGLYSGGKWTITGINGHVGSICFSHKDTLEHWNESGFLTEGGIKGGGPDQIYYVDAKNKTFYTLTETGYDVYDMILKKFKIIEPKLTLKGWSHKEIDKTKEETCIMERTSLVSGELFKKNYYYEAVAPAFSKSEIDYGTFHGHSIVQNTNWLIGFNYFKYNIIPDSAYINTDDNRFMILEDIEVETHTLVEIVLIDKFDFTSRHYTLHDVDDNTTTLIKAGTYDNLNELHNANDIVQMRVSAADDHYIYITAKSYDENEQPKWAIYTLPIAYLKDGIKITYYSDYDAAICHTINRRNGFFQSAWVSYENDVFGLGRKDGVNCFTGVFKQGMAAIANFNFDITESDSIEVSLEYEE